MNRRGYLFHHFGERSC